MNKIALMFLTLITLSNIAIYGQGQTEQSTITLPDPNLEAAIREAIDKSEGAIYISDLDKLEFLDASGSHIKDITGLEYCNNLENLSLSDNHISDVSPLSGLANLKELDLKGNQITDVSPLSGLANLTELDLSGNQIVDVSPLSGLAN